MKTPFTTEQFFNVFKNYNESVFPAQILFYLFSLLIIVFLIKPQAYSDKIIGALLSFFWLWMGIVYHLLFFTTINKAAYFFGGMFVLEGVFFLIFSVIKSKMNFRIRKDASGITGAALMIYALLVYPVLGYINGHIYPFSPTFGLPCPTTIFTFGILLFSTKKIPVFILLIPFIWSIIGFTAVFKFGVKEDIGLIISGLLTCFFLFFRSNRSTKVVMQSN